MATKSPKPAPTAPASPKAKARKSDGSQSNPHPWVEPFPASKMDSDGKTETVFVKATVGQDITLAGQKFAAGRVHTLPCGLAHAHASILSPPPAVKE